MATHFNTLKIKDIRQETPDCISVSFDIPESIRPLFQFKQGQNITIKILLDGEEIRRSYSICSSPGEHELRVAIKKAYAGKFSGFAHGKFGKGDLLDVLPPTGRFYTELDPANRKHYIAFAAGSGITPVISILKAVLATEPQSSFSLVYGNRNRGSILFKEELEALKNRYMDRLAIHHILSRETTDAPIYQGRIDTVKCRDISAQLLDTLRADEIFLCGPEEMIFSVKNWLEQQGMDKRKIHFELFSTPGTADPLRSGLVKREQAEAAATPAGKISKVTIRQDGIAFDFDLPFDGEPILDAALKQGVDLPFSCRGGVCCTCRAKLTEGRVEMENNYALEPDELEAGFILTCQSHPRTERVVVDFDSK